MTTNYMDTVKFHEDNDNTKLNILQEDVSDTDMDSSEEESSEKNRRFEFASCRYCAGQNCGDYQMNITRIKSTILNDQYLYNYFLKPNHLINIYNGRVLNLCQPCGFNLVRYYQMKNEYTELGLKNQRDILVHEMFIITDLFKLILEYTS